jgi:peptidoglycan hydrolase-like protein with peptidoglycan-binding domain
VRSTVQRTTGDGHDLTSPRFAGDLKLEACFDDEARLTQGATGEPVTKVQGALLELGYDLGPTGADGIYGQKTWNAVKAFKKTEQLGSEQMGDVGPGTMRRLNELFPGGGGGGGELPPCPIETDLDDNVLLAPSDTKAKFGGLVPGITCDLKKGKRPPQPSPLPTKLSEFPPDELKRLIVSAAVPSQRDIDIAYRFPVASSTATTTIDFRDTIIFETSVPASSEVREGLKSLIQTSRPNGAFPANSITDLAVGDARPADPKRSVVPGGVFRISNISHGKPASTVWDVSRVGDVAASDKASQGSVTSPGALSSKFTNVTLAPGWNSDEISALDAALSKLNQNMLKRLGRIFFIRTRGKSVAPDGEAAHYEAGFEPNRIEVFDGAFASTAQRSGLGKSIINTLLHELGHGEDFRKAGEQVEFKKAAIQDGAKVDTSGRKATLGGVSKTLTVSGGVTTQSDVDFGEYYADSFSLFIQEPEVLELIRPSVFNFFTKSFP